MDNKTIANRLEALREVMRRESIGAFIFPTSDPHQSEYTAPHWKGREWISGFNGSAGTAVVTLTGAALWTDSRYFIAAAQQLCDTEFQLMREKIDGTPTIAEWIAQEFGLRNREKPCLGGNASKRCNADVQTLRKATGRRAMLGNGVCSYTNQTEAAIDGSVWSASEAERLVAELRQQGGITLRTNFDPLRLIWRDRPQLPQGIVCRQPLEYAGETRASKLLRIRQALRREHADGMLMARLDDIAWTLNLRGCDVEFCPVFVSFLLISTTGATLFIDRAKLPADIRAELLADGVQTDEYANVAKGLRQYFEQTILMDPGEVSLTLMKALESGASGRYSVSILRKPSPVPAMKAIKNEAEQQGFRRAMIADGVAMVRLLMRIEANRAEPCVGGNASKRCNADAQTLGGVCSYTNETVAMTELDVCQWIEELRSQEPDYRGPSFATIAAYGANAAIVHYEPTPDNFATTQRRGLLLLDTGGQYLYGTTDVTRTIPLGPLTDDERRAYTLVLKGHLRLQNLHFPEGAAGTQLDAIARSPLWAEGLGYLHGTGHGVGSHLCVHEGPHQIRMEWRPAPLSAGMTITDEPGVYLEGRFGIRIENTLLVKTDRETECGRFLCFEPLTLCPIDRRPIVKDLLNDEEKQWLNDYHALVYRQLSPCLNPAEQQWLKQQTAPL